MTARPLRRYMRARVRAASLAPTYTITRDVTRRVRVVGAIGEQFCEKRKLTEQRGQQPDAAIAILNTS